MRGFTQVLMVILALCGALVTGSAVSALPRPSPAVSCQSAVGAEIESEGLAAAVQRWYPYRWLILAVLLVFLVLLLVVGVMGRLLRRMRHTQAALQMSESRYRRIVETAHEGIWVIDADESTVFVNRRMCEILGYSEPEMLGRNVLDFMDEEARGLARERITRRRQGESGQYEACWRARDGRAVWTRMAINPLWDEQGEYLGVLAMISDITEQHHARKALEESKSRFRQLTESIREVVWLGSPDWNEVVYISPAYETIWGRKLTSVRNNPHSWLEGVHPEDREALTAFTENLPDSDWDEVNFPEFRVMRPDGVLSWVAARVYSIRDANGRIFRVAGIAEDITDRKLVELALLRRGDWERLLSRLSARMIAVTAKDLPAAFEWALCELAEVAGADLAFVVLQDEARETAGIAYSWVAEEAPSVENLRQLPIGDLRPMLDLLEETGFYRVPMRDALRDIPGAFGAHLGEHGIRSLLIAAIHAKRDCKAFIALESLHNENLWEDADGRVLQTVAEIFASALARREIELALLASEAHVRLLMASTAEAIYGADTQGRCTFVNPACLRLLGYESADEMVGRSVDAVVHRNRCRDDSDTGSVCESRLTYTKGERIHSDQEVFWRRDGTAFPVEFWSNPIWDDGELKGAVVTFVDITERRRAESELRQAAIVFNNTMEGVMIVDAARHIVAVNPAFSDITGYGEQEVIGRPISSMAARVDERERYETIWECIENSGNWSGEVWNRRKSGEIYPEWMTLSAVRDEVGTLTHCVAVSTDISQLKLAQDRMEYLAHHDPLTDLPNRLLFHSRLEHAIDRALRQQSGVALLFLDLDGFKPVNDNLGHQVGDKLLVQVAERLRDTVRRDDTVARLGGDEFTIIMEGQTDCEGSELLAGKINHTLAEPFAVDGNEVFVSASIGVSLSPGDTVDAEELIRFADAAMYEAKQAGRNQHRFYQNGAR